jgi:ABC-type uncharacterized transport system YnjBCD substrate-binding protein
MRNINEVLYELEDIINSNLDTLHKLKDVAKTLERPDEQIAMAKSIACLWEYLKPVHRWIREVNKGNEAFYDELDKYIGNNEKHATPLNPIIVPEASKKIRRKK